MSSPAAASSPHKAGSVAPVSCTLDCFVCKEPFSPVVGPRYPRILTPCAHTFCTECIERQLQARGPNNFRCLTHDQHVAINKAEDAKANFALIELLEVIAKDADHQVVDERTKPPSCSECNTPSVWYCKNDDACFCDAHKISCHSSKAQSTHAIVPVADRTTAVVPKCSTHKSKELELWCTQCSVLCCTMCERSGAHKEHAVHLTPVDDVALIQRSTIERLATEAAELSADKLDKEAEVLIQLQTEYEASARRVQEALGKQQADIIRAVEARFAVLHSEAQSHLSQGFKHIALRVDDLTMSRSRAAMVSEEAARVLRMSDHAVLGHTASVEQNMVRTRQGWEEYQLNSKLPGMLELRYVPNLLSNELAVSGLVHQPWMQIDQGKPIAAAEPVVSLSAHRSTERAQHQQELAQLQHIVTNNEQALLNHIQLLENKCAEGEQQRCAMEAASQQILKPQNISVFKREQTIDQLQRLYDQLSPIQRQVFHMNNAR